MKRPAWIVAWFAPLLPVVWAGPFPPAAGQPGSEAVAADDPRIAGWAEEVHAYAPGGSVDPMWQDTAQALGRAEGNSFDVLSLGRGGSVTLRFDPPITNGDGADFAVFENAFSDTFLELAFVEVSTDGRNFARYPHQSRTAGPVDAYGTLDPTDVDGFAGKYRQGWGTPFDLDDAPGRPAAVTHVRLVDVVGDGRWLDAGGRPIHDPWPTTGSAGFDLDGVAVLGGAAPEIIGFAQAVGGLRLRFETRLGVGYAVEYAASLDEPWRLYALPVEGDGKPRSVFVHGSWPARHFRLRREALP